MKRYIDTIYINNPEIVSDIVCALENHPESGNEYEIEYLESNNTSDHITLNSTGTYKLVIYKIESMKRNSNDGIGFHVKNTGDIDITTN